MCGKVIPTTYAAAQAGGDYAGTSGVFTNPSGGGANPAAALTGLPDVLLTVPEPTSMALAALVAPRCSCSAAKSNLS